MCRESRAVWRYRLDLHRRAKRLTLHYVEVGRALARRLGSDGELTPSHATIARDAGVKLKTVQRALDALRACGMIQWVKRLVRDGWQAKQTSNSYALLLGEAPVFLAPAHGSQKARGISKNINAKSLSGLSDFQRAYQLNPEKAIEDYLRATP